MNQTCGIQAAKIAWSPQPRMREATQIVITRSEQLVDGLLTCRVLTWTTFGARQLMSRSRYLCQSRMYQRRGDISIARIVHGSSLKRERFG